MAAAYDRLEPWYGHLYTVLHAILDRALAPGPGGPGRALDAGCGTGFQARRLARLGWQVEGVDIAPALLARAREHGLRRVAQASLEALPFAAATFDAVACCGSTLSFVDAPARAVAELGRVLRPGGRLLLDCEHRFSLDLGWALLSAATGDALGYGQDLRTALGAIAAPLRRSVVVRYPEYGALRLFTRAELTALLEGAGLAVERVWGIHVTTNAIPSTVLHRPALPRPLALLFAALGRLDDGLRRLGVSAIGANSLVVLARKRPGNGESWHARCTAGGPPPQYTAGQALASRRRDPGPGEGRGGSTSSATASVRRRA
jgi:SAM-dependent methyltransferase